MTSCQLNIRLSPDARDQLVALAFVRRTHASTLARDIVLDFLDRYANEPGMEETLAGLAAHDTDDRPKRSVHRLDTAWSEGPQP